MEDLIKRSDVIKVIEDIETERLRGQINLTYAPTIKRINDIPSADLNEAFDEWASLWLKDFRALKHRLEVHEEAMLKTIGGDPHKATYINALENRIKELEADRPSGEWIWNNDAIDWNLGAWICSNCHARNDNIPHSERVIPLRWSGSKFCPNCGCRIRKENE